MAAAAIVHFVVTVAHDGTVKVVAHCFSHLSQIHSTISISDSATFALISDKHNHWDIERQALGGVATPCHNIRGHGLCALDTLAYCDWPDMSVVLASLVLCTILLPE